MSAGSEWSSTTPTPTAANHVAEVGGRCSFRKREISNGAEPGATVDLSRVNRQQPKSFRPSCQSSHSLVRPLAPSLFIASELFGRHVESFRQSVNQVICEN